MHELLCAPAVALLQHERQDAEREHDERHDRGDRQTGGREQQHERGDQAEPEIYPAQPAPAARLAAAGAQPRDVSRGPRFGTRLGALRR